MPKLGTFEAYIKVDGEALPECGVEADEPGKKATCWIPSEAGKEFSVCWKNLDPTVDIRGQVFVDGQAVGGKLVRTNAKHEAIKSSAITSSTTVRNFFFVPITYTDDDAYLATPTLKLGKIELKLHSVRLGSSGPKSTFCKRDKDDAKVHEKVKKSHDHRIQFGPERTVKAKTFTSFTELELLGKFVFKYRAIAMLQANGIAPPPPLPPPPPAPPMQEEPVQTSGNKRKSRNPELQVKTEDSLSEGDDEIDKQLKVLQEEIQKLEARRKKKRKSTMIKIEKHEPIISDEVIDLT